MTDRSGERSEPAAPQTLRIRAARVVIGRDRQVIHDGAVVISSGVITAVEQAGEDTWRDQVREVDYGAATVLPGLIDPHVHLSLSAGEDLDAHAREPLPDIVDRVSRIRTELLQRGITTVRDLGCRADVLQALRDRGGGPGRNLNVVASGPPITGRRGHFWPIGIEVEGPRSAVAAVDRLVGAGARVIKVMVTGGVMTPGTHIGRAQLTRTELAAVVQAAHDRGRRVAAHAHGTEGIALAVHASVDTIEHCSWTDASGAITDADPRLLDAMADAAQTVVTAGPLHQDLLAWLHHRALPDTPASRRQLQLWRNALRAQQHGVTVALGTDSMFGALPGARDLEARLTALVELVGWDRLDALQLVTGNAARALGDVKRGVLAPTRIADLAVFPGDLTSDFGGLTTPLAVWRHGVPVPVHREVQAEAAR